MQLNLLLDAIRFVGRAARLSIMSIAVPGLILAGCAGAQQDAVAQAADTPKLLPAPAEEEFKTANDLVTEVFKADLESAKTATDRQRVAKKLLQSGQDTKDDSLGRFALLNRGMELAAQGGDYSTAAKAIDELARTHAIDGLDLKRAALETVSKTVRLPKQHEAFCNDIIPLVQASASENRYSLAKQFAALLLRSAKAARNPKLATGATALSAEVDEQAREYESLTDALAKVKMQTAAASDKLAVGNFLCFLKGDFKNGLPLLAEGSDEPLSQLAADELSGPVESEDQLKLADAWWIFAEAAKGTRANHMRLHAAAWYERAHPKLAGLSAARSKQRIEMARKGNLDQLVHLSSTSAPPRPAAEAIDLLATLREKRPAETGFGVWKDTKAGIAVNKSAYCRVLLPYFIGGSGYDLFVEFEESGGEESVALILPIENRATVLTLDGWAGRGYRTYLCNVKGLEAVDNAAALRGKHLERGKSHRCHVDVSWDTKAETAKVIVALDDGELFSWEGKILDLSVQNGWDLGKPRVVGVGSYETPTLFKKVELIPK